MSTGSTDESTALQTVRWAHWVYGEKGVDRNDPAEAFHEASKGHSGWVDDSVRGTRLLERSPEMRASALRAVKRNPYVPTIPLPRPELPAIALCTAIERRRSGREFDAAELALGELGSLLWAAYGAAEPGDDGRARLRTVPSGGALYPLELYVVPAAVAGLEAALHHFDPYRHALERHRPLDPRADLEGLCPYPDLLTKAAAVCFVTAMFWRTRFKYGLRGYRFALIEAGHVAQNFVLAATALDLVAVPVGGLFDRKVDTFLGVDGVNESVLLALSVGRRP